MPAAPGRRLLRAVPPDEPAAAYRLGVELPVGQHVAQAIAVLVHGGAGGVGHFAIQFASFFGAHVVATGSTRNLEWMRELGANEVIDHTQTRFEDDLDPVDTVIDLIGNAVDDVVQNRIPAGQVNGVGVDVAASDHGLGSVPCHGDGHTP